MADKINVNREIINSDAISWLTEFSNLENKNISFVTSLPDYSEFPGKTLKEWQEWFINTAQLIINKTPKSGVTIFYQSDIKHEGRWIDKAFLCQKAAEKEQSFLLWHKVISRVPIGTTTYKRPSYSHILCFSKELKLAFSDSTPDILDHIGNQSWKRGMGFNACMIIAKFIKDQVSSQVIINPFCGHGSMLAIANYFQLDAIGIERSKKRASEAQNLDIDITNQIFIKTKS